MNSKFTITAFYLTLVACGSADATTPSASNPAHCIAAFAYARKIALSGDSGDINLAVQSTARAIYEGQKLRERGRFVEGQTEAAALLSANSQNDKLMMALIRDCLSLQDADSKYRAINETGALMAAARRADPACRNDEDCSRKIR